jgi:hypothetical protein
MVLPGKVHPLLIISLLDAIRRFDSPLHRKLVREHALSRDSLEALLADGVWASAQKITDVNARLHGHPEYHGILHLAGKNTFLAYLETLPHQPSLLDEILPKGAKTGRTLKALAAMVQPFLGGASVNVLRSRDTWFVELAGSIFATRWLSLFPVCTFYEGFFEEGFIEISGLPADVEEVRCTATDPNIASCLFEVKV